MIHKLKFKYADGTTLILGYGDKIPADFISVEDIEVSTTEMVIENLFKVCYNRYPLVTLAIELMLKHYNYVISWLFSRGEFKNKFMSINAPDFVHILYNSDIGKELEACEVARDDLIFEIEKLNKEET